MNSADILRKHVHSLDGYKISNTHFKIGSKIHSRDFYYAKRLFQNSYYTARIAMLLAMKIRDRLRNIEQGLTLVGYELYSELLISLIKKFLIDFGYNNVNHFVTIDTAKQIKHLPNRISINENVAIIVPIASTGSTALKIADYIKSLKAQSVINFLLPHFNILSAVDKSFTIKSGNFQTQEPIVQLETTWQKPSDCVWCYDDVYSLPLFETDKASLTPALIFDTPMAKTNSNSGSVNFDDVDFKKSLIYRRTLRNNEFFLFSTNTELLIQNNYQLILNWLEKIKKQLQIKASQKIVIISPCHYSNTHFINLINDKLFNSSATIIHHQSDVDYMSNFKLLNERYLNAEDVNIYFVDDTIISGKSFFNIYDLYRFTSDYEENKKFKGAIFLCNNSLQDTFTRVKRAANNNIYSFVDINMPLPPRIFEKQPIEHEISRYTDLSKIVIHDSLKILFSNKAKNLMASDHNSSESLKPDEIKSERHVKMFQATHKLYEFLAECSSLEGLTFFEVLQKCGFNGHLLDDRLATMKVLSQYPFLLYMPVRKKAFEWHKLWLNEKISELTGVLASETTTKDLEYGSFQELKFLIRRAVFLGNYKILSSQFFKLICRVSNILEQPNSVYKLVEQPTKELFESKIGKTSITEAHESEIKNVKDFHLFLLIQYIELIHKNPWCAKNVIESINSIGSDNASLALKRTFRMLKIEIAGVLNDFYMLLADNIEWRRMYKNDEHHVDENQIPIIEFLLSKNPDLLKKNKFSLANSVLGLLENQKPKPQFINYLWTKQFLQTDIMSYATKVSLTEKTEAIFRKLKGLFKENNSVGAFLVVIDGRKTSHIVYDKDANERRFLNDEIPQNNVIKQFLDGSPCGYNNAKDTIVEYRKPLDSNNVLENLYSIDNVLRFEEVESHINCKWLLMMRLCTFSNDYTEKVLGVIGFYSDFDLHNDLLAKQMLMLLRKDLGRYVAKHHKNDEFSWLREVEAVKRFAYLAGHGRHMIQKLSRDKPSMFGPIANTMEKLQYLFATKWISPNGNTSTLKSESNNILLKKLVSNSKINREVIYEIYDMGEEIFANETIENKVEVKFSKPCISGPASEFMFSAEVLKFICFELFINAKKNRYHFLPQHCSVCQDAVNSVAISVDLNTDKITLSITGTGPEIPQHTQNSINGNVNVKEDHEISGLNLIYKVIKSFDSNNALNIHSVLSKKCCKVYSNSVTIQLTPLEYES